MSNPHSHFQGTDLTAARLEALLSRLDTNRDRAGEKYEEIRWKLIRFFQWGSCIHAEELVDETFNRVAQRITSSEEEIQDVVGFLWGVAKNLRQEAIRRETRTVRLPDLHGGEESFAESQVVDLFQSEASTNKKRLKCLRTCIQGLSAEERTLLLAYHAVRGRRSEARRRLAAENGITMVALRVRVNRLRFKLEKCIKDYLSRPAD
jgi:RNA polymerase sigma factor (sigma-70 family)